MVSEHARQGIDAGDAHVGSGVHGELGHVFAAGRVDCCAAVMRPGIRMMMIVVQSRGLRERCEAAMGSLREVRGIGRPAWSARCACSWAMCHLDDSRGTSCSLDPCGLPSAVRWAQCQLTCSQVRWSSPRDWAIYGCGMRVVSSDERVAIAALLGVR